MRSLRIFILLVLCAVFCQHCSLGTAPEDNSTEPDPQPGRTPEQLTDAEKTTASAANAFGLKLFDEIAAENIIDTNLFVSPLSVSYALGMAYNGASGKTRTEMAEAMELSGMSIDDINKAYLGLMTMLCELDPDVILEIANSIWYDTAYAISSDFVDINQQYFDALVSGLDLQALWVPDTINHWIDLHTHGMITKMIDPPIDPDLMTMLINAIYFKGLWTDPFVPEYTHQTQFFKADGSIIMCDIMPKDSILPFYSNDLFNATHLPYGNKYFNMMIMLPQEDKTTTDIIDNFTPANWDVWRSGFSNTTVMLGLPKFKYSFDIDLIPALKVLGMQEAFTGAADFTNMFPHDDMYISFVKHKAIIKVDEYGTEAAAVTVIGGTTSMPPQVYCNRPFVFVVYEKVTGTILFIGRVAQPVWND